MHEPAKPSGDGLAITHGAGGDCNAALLKAVADAFTDAGLWVLRFNLPYRQARPHGSPSPAQAARDREGIQRAVDALREIAGQRMFLSGHSYGGRQATMLAAENPAVADAMLLLSYPLHPPGKPQQLRTAHFPELRIPGLFMHGTRDAFGSIEEMQEALRAIPAPTELVAIERGRHGLPPAIAASLPSKFFEFVNRTNRR